jgi:hypothetical protein
MIENKPSSATPMHDFVPQPSLDVGAIQAEIEAGYINEQPQGNGEWSNHCQIGLPIAPVHSIVNGFSMLENRSSELEVETHEHECYGMEVDLVGERVGVLFHNGHLDGVTYLNFATLRDAGFKVPNKEEYNNAKAMAVVERFVQEWKNTWVDPEESSHEWAELYQMVLESR